MIGIKLMIGPPVSNPSRLFSHPHWNTAVVNPYVARTLSRNPTVALIGTRMDRNTNSRMIRESKTIIPM
ncbi:hypothetical protein D3C81_2262410 [compost metagenome]